MRAGLKTRKRLLLTLAALTALFFLIVIRIGSLATVQSQALTARGVRQWTREGVVTARRGAIQDANGDVLALSASAYIVSANPQLVEDAHAFSQLLGPLLNADPETMERKLSNQKLASVILKRQVSRETVDQIR